VLEQLWCSSTSAFLLPSAATRFATARASLQDMLPILVGLEGNPGSSTGRSNWMIGFSKRSCNMKSLSKWISGLVAIVVLAGTATAANDLIAGKVKSVNADKKEFVLTDGANKDHTLKLGDEVVINRGGKEGSSDLKADDAVSICYHKGTLAWTAHYILVKEGDTKDYQLMNGSFKSYDADQKTFTYTDVDGKDWTYAMNGAKVRLNMQASKIEDLKIGDSALVVVQETGDKRVLKDLIISRKN